MSDLDRSGDPPYRSVPTVPRPEVAAFAVMMEERLRKHEDRGPWRDDPADWLLNAAWRHIRAVEAAVATGERETIWKEATDCANFMMMIADRTGGVKTS